MSEALAIRQEDPEIADREHFMPALSIETAVERFNMLVEFVKTVMRKDIDFGVIPGTEKPSLLKPGAEKLCTLFGLTSRFQLIGKVEDWTGKDHNGEPFFYYHYRCQLYRNHLLITEADGSANSFEQKYRWRKAERKCQLCGKNTIIKGKPEYGGGWICLTKKGGCGTKYPIGDPAIESQQVGRVPNQDIYDQVNTIQKIGQKRSLVAAVLLAVNASEFFTQDIEDMAIVLEWEENRAATSAKEFRSAQTVTQPQPNSNVQNLEDTRLKLIDRINRLRKYEAKKLGVAPDINLDLTKLSLDKLKLACKEAEASVRDLITNSILDLHAEMTILDRQAPIISNLDTMSIAQLDSYCQAMEARLSSLRSRG